MASCTIMFAVQAVLIERTLTLKRSDLHLKAVNASTIEFLTKQSQKFTLFLTFTGQKSLFQVNLDFWTHPSHEGAPVDIHVKKAEYPKLAKQLHAEGITFTILITDVQTLLDNENPPSRSERAGFDYGRYNQLKQVRKKIYTEHSTVERLKCHDCLGR